MKGRFSVGRAQVRIINVGDLSFKLKDTDNIPESEWRNDPLAVDAFETPHLYPSQCFLILLPDASILVDAGDYALFAALDKEHAPKDYYPPPDLFQQLAEAGLAPERITHVVITHAHYDHFAGVTRKDEKARVRPSFPNAKYFLGKPDWVSKEMQENLKDLDSAESNTFGYLQKLGLLELVEKDRELTSDAKIIVCPGETPGHQIVKISSGGETMYCVGDLFHHEVEVENPSWMAMWADPNSNLRSKTLVIESSIKENAIIAPAHMPLGRVAKAPNGRIKFTPI